MKPSLRCSAQLCLGDDYGDGRTTCRCQLPPDHDGSHVEESGGRGGHGSRGSHSVKITWEGDDRILTAWTAYESAQFELDEEYEFIEKMPEGWDWRPIWRLLKEEHREGWNQLSAVVKAGKEGWPAPKDQPAPLESH